MKWPVSASLTSYTIIKEMPPENNPHSPNVSTFTTIIDKGDTMCDQYSSLSHTHTPTGGCRDVNINLHWMYHPPPPGGKGWQRCVDMWCTSHTQHHCDGKCSQHMKTHSGDLLASHSCSSRTVQNPMRGLTTVSATDHWSIVSTDHCSRKVRQSEPNHTLGDAWLHRCICNTTIQTNKQ